MLFEAWSNKDIESKSTVDIKTKCIQMGKGFELSKEGKKRKKTFVNPQMLAVKVLIKHLDYCKESEDVLHQFS